MLRTPVAGLQSYPPMTSKQVKKAYAERTRVTRSQLERHSKECWLEGVAEQRRIREEDREAEAARVRSLAAQVAAQKRARKKETDKKKKAVDRAAFHRKGIPVKSSAVRFEGQRLVTAWAMPVSRRRARSHTSSQGPRRQSKRVAISPQASAARAAPANLPPMDDFPSPPTSYQPPSHPQTNPRAPPPRAPIPRGRTVEQAIEIPDDSDSDPELPLIETLLAPRPNPLPTRAAPVDPPSAEPSDGPSSTDSSLSFQRRFERDVARWKPNPPPACVPAVPSSPSAPVNPNLAGSTEGLMSAAQIFEMETPLRGPPQSAVYINLSSSVDEAARGAWVDAVAMEGDVEETAGEDDESSGGTDPEDSDGGEEVRGGWASDDAGDSSRGLSEYEGSLIDDDPEEESSEGEDEFAHLHSGSPLGSTRPLVETGSLSPSTPHVEDAGGPGDALHAAEQSDDEYGPPLRSSDFRGPATASRHPSPKPPPLSIVSSQDSFLDPGESFTLSQFQEAEETLRPPRV